ncbi:MAG: flavin-dependent oxidoreductase [Acidobacteria bacterium]|nr:flavin-dependent oxidoreductase [Acidobacteriota bacterium]
MKVIIAGGGIGGLVTALCLERAGIEARIFESAAEIRPLGVGINLLPHSVRILTALGLDAQLAATGIETAELIYFNKFGQLIWREPRGRAAGYTWPQYSIHRGRLQMLLYDTVRERLGDGAVQTGCHLDSFVERGAQVEATFVKRVNGRATGEIVAVESGDVLIGADGIHSRVRHHFYPDEKEPQFSGKVLRRGVIEGEPYLTGRSMFMAGYANRKFVAYPIDVAVAARGRSLINWVADVQVGDAYSGTPRDWNRQVEKNVVLPYFDTWHFDWLNIPQLIESAAAIYEFPMIDRDPVERWSFGRVTLLGDAAHPMYPIGSNGASQAILDAPALVEALTTEADVVRALQRYEQERLQPTARIVLSNRQQGPEECMQLVEERAPNGFTNLHDVISPAELEEIAGRYKQIAGFSREALNAKS